jgi:hypothetical protein
LIFIFNMKSYFSGHKEIINLYIQRKQDICIDISFYESMKAFYGDCH